MISRSFERRHLEVWEKYIQGLFKDYIECPVELKILPSCEIIWDRNEIGRGAYSQVYKAVLKEGRTNVAAKKLNCLQDSRGYIKIDVIRDLWFTNMLKHENIIKLYFICVHASMCYS